MSIDEMRDHLGELRDEMDALLTEDTLTTEQEERFDALAEEADTLRTSIEQREQRERRLDGIRMAARAGHVEPGADDERTAPNVNTRTGADPFALDGLRFDTPTSELRSRAEACIERAIGDLTDSHREAASKVLRSVRDPQGILARRIIATGSPEYREAFQLIAGGQAHLMEAKHRQALQRAQSLVDANGGFAIPFTLDPTIIMTNDGAANPFRQVCRTATIVTDAWNGVSTAGVSGGYAAEGSEVGDDSATLAQPSVKPERWDVFVPFSFEVGQDWANLENDVRMMVNEKRDEFDVVAFTSGSGTDEPTGIITELDGTASEVTPATAETFASADVYAVEAALPPKYRRTAAQAQWMAALGTAQAIRQFDTSGGSELWERIGAGLPPELLGHPFNENSAMDSAADINAAATADNHVLVLGDWSNYLIVDRVGLNMELVPHLFDTANNRPSGQRGFLAWGRTGAGALNINAFRVLNVATTA